MLKAEMKNMSVKDRLILMEEPWDSLCKDEKELESPEWHKDVLDERRSSMESGKAEFISIDELKVGKKQ